MISYDTFYPLGTLFLVSTAVMFFVAALEAYIDWKSPFCYIPAIIAVVVLYIMGDDMTNREYSSYTYNDVIHEISHKGATKQFVVNEIDEVIWLNGNYDTSEKEVIWYVQKPKDNILSFSDNHKERIYNIVPR